MSNIRDNYRQEDIQRCVYQMLNELTGSPWTDWEIILSYPETDVFEQFTKPFIYVEPPFKFEDYFQQGGRESTDWEMVIGSWDDNKTGSQEEINIISSHLDNLFMDAKRCNNTETFTITLGSTEYADTDLITMGVRVLSVKNTREIAENKDIKEFRRELTLEIRT